MFSSVHYCSLLCCQALPGRGQGHPWDHCCVWVHGLNSGQWLCRWKGDDFLDPEGMRPLSTFLIFAFQIVAIHKPPRSCFFADCEYVIFQCVQVVGNMGEAMEAADASVKTTLVKCMRQPATTLSVQLAAIQAFRRMSVTNEVSYMHLHFPSEIVVQTVFM